MEEQKLQEFAEFLDAAKKRYARGEEVFVFYKGIKRNLLFLGLANEYYTIDGITEYNPSRGLYWFSSDVSSSQRIGEILPDLEWVEKPAIQEVI